MIKFYRKTRFNYWSLSPLAKWLREKAGLTNPYALSGPDWDLHHKECKEKAPLIYWLTKNPFNTAQNIVMFPVDVWYSIKVFYKNWKGNSHVLDGGLPVGQWNDLCYRIPRCLFGELEKFIEIEKGLDTLAWEKKLVFNEDWGYSSEDEGFGAPTNQALAAMEQELIYNWWKANKDRDFYEESGYTDISCKEREGGLFSKQTDEMKEAFDKLDALEAQYTQEEEAMLIRLLKIKDSLWS